MMESLPLWTAALLVFFLRVLDVSLGTVRTIAVVNGRTALSVVFGFMEVLVWLLAVAQVLTRINEHPVLVLAFAGGYAAGNGAGVMLERIMALGSCVVSIISVDRGPEITAALRAMGQPVTTIRGEGQDGDRTLLYVTCARRDLDHVMDTALDPQIDGVAHRAGAIRTTVVSRRTTLLLVRFRYDIITRRASGEQSQLAEECCLMAFAGAPASAEWLDEDEAEALLHAEPGGNVLPEQARTFVERMVEGYDALRPHLEREAGRRAEQLLDAHRRVRAAAGVRGVRYRVEPKLPPDVLGIYVYLPVSAGGPMA